MVNYIVLHVTLDKFMKLLLQPMFQLVSQQMIKLLIKGTTLDSQHTQRCQNGANILISGSDCTGKPQNTVVFLF